MSENEIIYSNIQTKPCTDICWYCDHFWGGFKNCSFGNAPPGFITYYTQEECVADTANQC